jgi:HPt (histidine-containing phosphotransfer) domain-containing protein
MSTATPPGSIELGTTDPDALVRLRRFGGAKLLNEMIAVYLESAPARLAAAWAGLAAGDAVATENAFHSLKSSSAQLGAVRLSRLCEEGETLARGRTLTGIAALIEASGQELRRVERWLESERARRQT